LPLVIEKTRVAVRPETVALAAGEFMARSVLA
jgi:hypothetical protein